MMVALAMATIMDYIKLKNTVEALEVCLGGELAFRYSFWPLVLFASIEMRSFTTIHTCRMRAISMDASVMHYEK